MKRRAWIAGVAALAMALAVFTGSGVASAQEDHSGAVKARQAYMQLNGFYMGQLAAVAKGQVPYRRGPGDRDRQQPARSSPAWTWARCGRQGPANDNPALAGKTRALPEIWTTFPAVVEKADALSKALEAMVVAAGTDPRQPSRCLRRRRCRLRRLPSQLPRREVLTRGCFHIPQAPRGLALARGRHTSGNSGSSRRSPSRSRWCASGNGGETSPGRTLKRTSSPTQRWTKARRRAGRRCVAGRAVDGQEVEGNGVAGRHVERDDLELIAASIDVRHGVQRLALALVIDAHELLGHERLTPPV